MLTLDSFRLVNSLYGCLKCYTYKLKYNWCNILNVCIK